MPTPKTRWKKNEELHTRHRVYGYIKGMEDSGLVEVRRAKGGRSNDTTLVRFPTFGITIKIMPFALTIGHTFKGEYLETVYENPSEFYDGMVKVLEHFALAEYDMKIDQECQKGIQPMFDEEDRKGRASYDDKFIGFRANPAPAATLIALGIGFMIGKSK